MVYIDKTNTLTYAGHMTQPTGHVADSEAKEFNFWSFAYTVRSLCHEIDTLVQYLVIDADIPVLNWLHILTSPDNLVCFMEIFGIWIIDKSWIIVLKQ